MSAPLRSQQTLLLLSQLQNHIFKDQQVCFLAQLFGGFFAGGGVSPKVQRRGGMVELGLLEQSEVGCRKCVALGLAEEL